MNYSKRVVSGSNRVSGLLSCFFAPQMQQQELAQMRQRDANLTALAAIGPRKKRKLDSPGGSAAGTEVRNSQTVCSNSAPPQRLVWR